jgi:uncharacterized OB-fold protein
MSETAERRGFGVAPAMTAENREFWAGAERGQFIGERCTYCRRYLFPPRSFCPGCGARELAAVAITGVGTVYSFTVNWNRWQPDLPVPFALVLAEFADAPGFRLLGRMHGDAIHDLRVGQAVKLGFDPGPAGLHVPCFSPVGGDA